MSKPKTIFKNRNLTSGTKDVSHHGLGGPVEVNTVQSNRIRLTSSIYISRLQTNVTNANITSFIKDNIPSFKDEDMYLRLLVKKDQDINELSFVSYRLSYTPQLYKQLIDPSFWPSHVKIGEFIERPRENSNSNKMGSFLSTRHSHVTNQTFFQLIFTEYQTIGKGTKKKS